MAAILVSWNGDVQQKLGIAAAVFLILLDPVVVYCGASMTTKWCTVFTGELEQYRKLDDCRPNTACQHDICVWNVRNHDRNWDVLDKVEMHQGRYSSR